jgi:hypothetical protein
MMRDEAELRRALEVFLKTIDTVPPDNAAEQLAWHAAAEVLRWVLLEDKEAPFSGYVEDLEKLVAQAAALVQPRLN